ncbi:zinc finger protein 112-like [Megalops cyprinoides]|uniref:zinc finger protein 112-like n=1 Tax=Megalops cyprinoides TaxID=118141 RepID=UPI001864E61B|nr:zinc finger protein 112-like [Megalops cyprinoides]
MSNCISFHSQLASIMEVLSKAAVAEITKLVDDGSAVLRLEVCRSQKENAALKRRLQLMEKELRAARGCRDRAQEGSVNISLEVQVCDESGGAEELPEKGNRPAVEAVCDGPLSSGLTCDGETAPGNKEETPSQIVALKYESTDVDQDWPESHMLSEERRQSTLERSRSQAKHRIGGELQWGVSQPSAAHGVEEAASEPWHSEEELDTKPTPAEDPGQLGAAYRPEEFRGLEATLKQQPDLCTQSLHQAGAATGLRLQSVWSKHSQRTQQDISAEHGLAVCSPDESEEGTPFDAFKTHESDHTAARLYACTQCGKRFRYKGNLKIHQRVHTGEKPFTCMQCGKCFSQISNLKTHQIIHTGEKSYSCTDCGKRFAHLCNLKTHQRVHTGEKPFTCTQCGKSFSQSHVLQKHVLTHSGD